MVGSLSFEGRKAVTVAFPGLWRCDEPAEAEAGRRLATGRAGGRNDHVPFVRAGHVAGKNTDGWA